MSNNGMRLNENLLQQLRAMAREGKQAKELIERIQNDLNLPPHYMVPVLDHLMHAFSIPLQILLPLRGDEGAGPEGRALQILFWFAALMVRQQVYPWNWEMFWTNFPGRVNPQDLERTELSGGYLEVTRPGELPWYLRCLYEVFIDKLEAFGPSPQDVFREVHCFTEAVHASIDQGVNPDGRIQLACEFQVEDQGPKIRAVCMARAWVASVENSGLSAATR